MPGERKQPGHDHQGVLQTLKTIAFESDTLAYNYANQKQDLSIKRDKNERHDLSVRYLRRS